MLHIGLMLIAYLWLQLQLSRAFFKFTISCFYYVHLILMFLIKMLLFNQWCNTTVILDLPFILFFGLFFSIIIITHKGEAVLKYNYSSDHYDILVSDMWRNHSLLNLKTYPEGEKFFRAK